MGRESEMVQVLALAEAMSVDVAIEYLDGRHFDKALTRHEFGPSQNDSGSEAGSSTTKVTLLYRPGHYDILYLRHPRYCQLRSESCFIACIFYYLRILFYTFQLDIYLHWPTHSH